MNDNYEFILQNAGLLYGVQLIRENTNGCSGNKIFEVERGADAFILRVAKHTQKALEHTEFELDWLAFLGESCDHLARPVKSVNGKLYEIISTENQSYILCLFERAFGKNPSSENPDEFNENLFFDLGAVMGEMHKLTARYSGNVVEPKFQWDNDAYSWRGSNEILDEDVRLRERMLLEEMHTLPISTDCYGIIHYDIHIDNFFVNEGKIKVFDFYDCQFNWYAADIASAIFFMVQKGAGPLTYKSEEERTLFAQRYITSYLKGYLSTNVISKFWIYKIDLFIKYQMTDEYRAAQSFWKEELIHLKDWYLQWHKDRIINDLPYVFVDYEKVIESLPPVPDR